MDTLHRTFLEAGFSAGGSLIKAGAALSTAGHLLSGYQEAQTARLEAQVLLRHVLGITRAQMYCRLDSTLSPDDLRSFISLVERRLAGEPVAYITGSREFYGLDFAVDRRVLIPRPETEILVEAIVRRFERTGRAVAIADVGTGSGAIAVTLAANLPIARVIGCDASLDALQVAMANVVRHGVGDRVVLVQGDLLAPLRGPLDVVAANLPYIRRSRLRALPRDVRDFEPLSALDGGEDGLDWYRHLLPQARELLARPGWILLEIDPDQRENAVDLVRQHVPSAQVSVIKDYAGFDRVVSVEVPS